jgi:hypothetical protein
MDSPPHRWRTGTTWIGTLPSHLRDVSAAASNISLDHYGGDGAGSVLVAATTAGVALEAAIKYSLASTNPVLIAKNPTSAILLARSTSSQIDMSEVRTLDGAEALRALRLLKPQTAARLPTARDVEEVLAVRNAAAHLGHVTPEDLDVALRGMVRCVNLILAELEDDGDFWDERNWNLAETLGLEAMGAAALELQVRLAAARRRFEALSEVAADALESHAQSLASPPEVVLFSCPVCERTGTVTRYVTKSDLDFTGARYPDEHPSGHRYAYPVLFHCLVCSVELDDHDMQAVASGWGELEEEELEPSEEFEQALEDWRYESRTEIERERHRDTWILGDDS